MLPYDKNNWILTGGLLTKATVFNVFLFCLHTQISVLKHHVFNIFFRILRFSAFFHKLSDVRTTCCIKGSLVYMLVMVAFRLTLLVTLCKIICKYFALAMYEI